MVILLKDFLKQSLRDILEAGLFSLKAVLENTSITNLQGAKTQTQNFAWVF